MLLRAAHNRSTARRRLNRPTMKPPTAVFPPHEELPAARAWHALGPEQVLAALSANRSGLNAEEAQRRLAEHGANELPTAPPPGLILRFARQFHNVLIYSLLVAAGITLLIGHTLDAAVIFGVVLINAVIGVVQEGKAERALAAVHAMLAVRATVLRDGERHEIPARELVPGDIVLLDAGDRIPGDVRLLRAKNLRVEEAALTGESLPVDKNVAAVREDAVLAERASLGFTGTTVTFGQATGIVVATGPNTEIGRIGTLVSSVPTLATPLTRKLDQFGRRITAFIIAGAVLVFLFGYLVHQFAAMEIFMAVVGLAVAAIPEGLPVIVTVTLALGTQRMARHNAIVRRLPAVETLGSVTVICSDKTGTLTRNEMTVVRALLPAHEVDVTGAGYAPEGGFARSGAHVDPAADGDLLRLARCGLLCNDATVRREGDEWKIAGDPTEGALVTLALKCGLSAAEELASTPRVDEIPFDSRHCFMATLHHDHAGHSRIFLKGAPESVLQLAVEETNGAPLQRAEWERRIDEAGRAGQRLLAMATREMPRGTAALSMADIVPRFTLLGLAAMIDPPRPEAIRAIDECHAAGVQVKMITGDHAVTAAAIGAQLGLKSASALAGSHIDDLDDSGLAARLATTDVIARASPEHKLRIVKVLQESGELVAMTGDGVNDAPALRAANIGVAMGRKGTDAAREAADLVLTDDNFASIGNAVREGRTIYDNIKKALVFILPTNGGQAGVILLAVFLGLTLPVTAVQILWVNMVTTVTLAIALAFEPTESAVMRRPPRPPNEPLITRRLLGRVAYVSVLMTATTFWVFTYELEGGQALEVARTAAVNMIVFGELFYLFNSRFFVASSLSRQTLYGNPAAVWVSLALVGLQLAFTYAPPLQRLFGTQPLEARTWLIIGLLALAMFLAVEAEKALFRWRGVRSI
jgi:magnesium-transporting ATPase (P-type)